MKIRLFRRFYNGETDLPDDQLVIGQEEYDLSKEWADRFLSFMGRIEHEEGDPAVFFIFEPKEGKEEEVWNLYWTYKAGALRNGIGNALSSVFFLVMLILLILKIF